MQPPRYEAIGSAVAVMRYREDEKARTALGDWYIERFLSRRERPYSTVLRGLNPTGFVRPQEVRLG